jgi:hypothetical protein
MIVPSKLIERPQDRRLATVHELNAVRRSQMASTNPSIADREVAF